MMTLIINEKEYKVKFGYNSFCDTDLMDRTTDLIKIFSAQGISTDQDVYGMGKIKDLFNVVRELLFVGFKKYNPVLNVQEVGELLDEYHDQAPEGEKRGIIDLFAKLTEELMAEGFFGELMSQIANATPKKTQKK